MQRDKDDGVNQDRPKTSAKNAAQTTNPFAPPAQILSPTVASKRPPRSKILGQQESQQTIRRKSAQIIAFSSLLPPGCASLQPFRKMGNLCGKASTSDNDPFAHPGHVVGSAPSSSANPRAAVPGSAGGGGGPGRTLGGGDGGGGGEDARRAAARAAEVC